MFSVCPKCHGLKECPKCKGKKEIKENENNKTIKKICDQCAGTGWVEGGDCKNCFKGKVLSNPKGELFLEYLKTIFEEKKKKK